MYTVRSTEHCVFIDVLRFAEGKKGVNKLKKSLSDVEMHKVRISFTMHVMHSLLSYCLLISHLISADYL